MAFASKAIEYVVAVIDFSAFWFGLARCQPDLFWFLFRGCGYGSLGLDLHAEVLRKPFQVDWLEYPTPTYSQFGLGHGSDAIGVLNTIRLDPDYFAYVLES